MKSTPGNRNVFLALSWRLELFTHIVPVPISIYFSATLVPMTEQQSMTAFVAGTISGTLMFILGMIWRYFRLRNVYAALRSDDHLKFKKGLLNHPLQETIVIAMRWLIGVPLAHAMYVLYHGGFDWSVHASSPGPALGPQQTQKINEYIIECSNKRFGRFTEHPFGAIMGQNPLF